MPKKIHCPHCFETFTPKSIRSKFVKNKTLCTTCKKWIDTADMVSNIIDRPIRTTPDRYKEVKVYNTDSPKFIPNSILSEHHKQDIVHYCKPDYYKYEMFKASGNNV